MPTALIGPAIGAVTGIIGAKKKANAANKAGEILAAAGEQAGKDVTAAGERGIEGINRYGEQAGHDVEVAGDTASQGVLGAGARGVNRIMGTSEDLKKYSGAGDRALSQIEQLTSTPVSANRYGDFQFDPSQFMNDAGVQFRIKQGNDALQNSAAARGILQSGNTLKAIQDYSQGVASDEFGKAYDRSLSSYNTNRDTFNLNESLARMNQNDRTNLLLSIYGTGAEADRARLGAATDASQIDLSSAMGSGGFITNAAQNAGTFRTNAASNAAQIGLQAADRAADYRTSGQSGRASGVVGAGNAWGSGIAGIGNAVGGADWGGIFGKKVFGKG